jgi:excisionase family DNA binding protein
VPKDDFYDFDKALERLGLEAEELKRLVSEGEIRAFREGGNMRLRAEDVENLRRGIEEGAFLEEDAEDNTEELVFEEDGLGEDEVGMATTQLSEEETLLDEEEVKLEKAEAASDAAGAAKVQRQRSRTAQLAAEGQKQNPLFLGIAVLTAIIALVCGIPAAAGGAAGLPSAASGWFVDNVGKAFAGAAVPEKIPTSIAPTKR